MFLKWNRRNKDGKIHRYWSIVENRRVRGGRIVQKQVLYLGEINDSQREAWIKSIEIFEEGKIRPSQIALFPEDRLAPLPAEAVVHIKLKELQLSRPRQWGACWLASQLWEHLQLDSFWQKRLPPSRKHTRWLNVLKVLCFYRLIDPGSEWRLHRHWFEQTALADILAEDFNIAEIHKLYRCLDKLLEHKDDLFSYLTQRWKDLFNMQFDILLYDLTSTYFEADAEPFLATNDKRKFGYSRDKRSDCVQVVIALVVTPEGFPLAYEVMPGNTRDTSTLPQFVHQIQQQYGQAHRIWVMDRGIPTEEHLQAMRQSDPPVYYLVGTARGKLTKLEKKLLDKPWEKVREKVQVKLLNEEGELYILAHSEGRCHKERSMRQRKLKRLWKRLHEIGQMEQTYKDLLLRLGAAKKDAGRAYGLVKITLPKANEKVTAETFRFKLDKTKLRQIRQREGHYLLRSNLKAGKTTQLWEYYIQLTEVEEAFKNLKSDLKIRPVYHQKEDRVEAHIFVSFLAYCLQVTLKRRLKELAPGLTPRAVLEKFSVLQMLDVKLPTTDGRWVEMSRYSEPEKDLKLLLRRLKLELPRQPPPKITARQ